ncbi:MAG TPA: type VI secretion system domain-containing protein, partial [Terriglobia bacterium]|nr:type VI secretion system domain-containing protein [Terriglobia bacterium]
AKKKTRDEAIEEKKLTPEEFDETLAITKKAFYQEVTGEIDAALESIENLDGVCNEKFGDIAPAFGNLRTSLEEVKQTIRILLKKKEEQEPSAETAEEESAEPAAEIGEEITGVAAEPEAEQAATAARPRTRKALSEEPADRDDAIQRVVAVARYLRQQEPYSPVPFLMLRALRWGELRAGGSEIDATLLDPPPTEIRQQIKRASLEGQWQEVLEAAETAVGMPCGRGWLDVHRYAVRACAELGSYYDLIAAAVRSELKALLADYPGLPELTLMDDTPVANGETQSWLREEIVPPPPAPVEAVQPEEVALPVPVIEPQDEEPGEDAPPDAYELANQAARQGRTQEAVAILASALAQEHSGRARFHRKIQLAGICMVTGNESIAFPILEELSGEIERRRLEEWEPPEMVAQPLMLLFKCLTKLEHDAAERQKVYERICRLDPAQALNCLK